MKSIVLFIDRLGELIKNKFFNDKNYTNNLACSQWQKYTKEIASQENHNKVTEYLNNYLLTTRWQTV